MIGVQVRANLARGFTKFFECEFYTIELAPLSDGRVFVSIVATTATDAEECQLFDQCIVAAPVQTIGQAIALIIGGFEIDIESNCSVKGADNGS